MELVGAVVVALLGACVGVLVGLYLLGAQRNKLAEQQHAAMLVHAEQAQQQRAAARALAEKQHAELRGHLMTMTAALAERMQLVGAALAAELRQVNAEHRNDLRLAIGLPRASMPDDELPPTRPTMPPPRPAAPPKLDASTRTSTRTPPGAAPAPRAPLPKPALPPKPMVSAQPIAPASSRPAVQIPTAPPTPRSAKRTSTGDEPTPPSGWTLEQVRTHTETAEERRP